MSRKLTAQLQSKIIQAIQSGGYPHIAAEAMTVPLDQFDDWLQRGDRPNAREPYRSFAGDVDVARAQARLIAEIAVYKDDPRIWLLHGPGRETSDAAGWTLSVKTAEHNVEQRNALHDPELMQLFRFVTQALAPFPEARGQVMQTLVNLGVNENAA